MERNYIKEFYTHQQEMTDAINEQYKQYKDKDVNITIVVGEHTIRLNNVRYLRTEMADGYLYLSYSKLLIGGGVSRRESDCYIPQDSVVTFEIIDDK